jgi:hypothetical protein
LVASVALLALVLIGKGGGDECTPSEVDFFRRRKNEEGFLLSDGGGCEAVAADI